MPDFAVAKSENDPGLTGLRWAGKVLNLRRIAAPFGATYRRSNASTKVESRSMEPAIGAAPVPAARSRQILALVIRVLGLLIALAGIQAGLWMRTATFTGTAPIRFVADVQNAINQGTRVLWTSREVLRETKGKSADVARNADLSLHDVLAGEVRVYDKIVAAHPNDHNYDLDYTPARLFIASLWARYGWSVHPSGPAYGDDIATPMLRLNTSAVALAALGAFFLVRRWWLCHYFGIHRGPAPGMKRASIGRWWGYERNASWGAGLGSALLVWLSPAVILDGHGFPQWDVWVLPFAIWALWFASHGNRNSLGWLAAGILIGVGAMLKGQILLGMLPVLLVWALLGRPLAGVWQLCWGIVTGSLLVVWPWLFRDTGALPMVGAGCTAALLSVGIRWLPLAAWRWTARATLLVAAALTLGATGYLTRSPLFGTLVLATAVVAVAIATWHSSSRQPSQGAVVAAVSSGVFCASSLTLLCGIFLGGSFSWLNVGFVHPTDHYPHMSIGPTSNLPIVLNAGYNLNVRDVVASLPTGPGWQWLRTLIGPHIDMKFLLGAIYGIGSALVGFGLWRNARHGSRQALVAMGAGWVLMFAVLPQMHERYLVWGAAMTALAATASPGLFLLHVYVTAQSFVMILHQMMICGDRNWSPWAMRLVGPLHPGLGWSIPVIAAVLIYLSVSRARPSENSLNALPTRR
jgi:hypothetical protein